jgi:hypothetical protein
MTQSATMAATNIGTEKTTAPATLALFTKLVALLGIWPILTTVLPSLSPLYPTLNTTPSVRR